MDLAFGVAAYQRNRGNLPELPLVNMFVEEAPTEPRQVTLQSRPGLEDNELDSGSDPVIAVFQRDGVLGGDTFTVTRGASTKLYRDGVLEGTLTGTGPASMAGNEIGLAVNCGGPIYYHDGTTLTEADFPDDANVCKVLDLAGRFIALRSDTQKFYWTEVLSLAIVNDLLTFDALAFASAENEPDALVDACIVDDILVLGGKETVEFWARSSDNDLPFTPIPGRVLDKGVKATGCMVPFAGSFAYVSAHGRVLASNDGTALSDAGIEERIADSGAAALWTFEWEGKEFLNLRLAEKTMAFNGQWTEWTSFGQSNFACQCASGTVFGSAIDGSTYRFSDNHVDLGDTLERRFRAGKALTGGSEVIDNLKLRTNPGQTPYLTGEYAEPVCEMRYSRDAGMTWGNWQSVKMGAQGEYRKRLEWRALGTFDEPGMLFEFRVTDPVAFRCSGVVANEDSGGRSR